MSNFDSCCRRARGLAAQIHGYMLNPSESSRNKVLDKSNKWVDTCSPNPYYVQDLDKMLKGLQRVIANCYSKSTKTKDLPKPKKVKRVKGKSNAWYGG